MKRRTASYSGMRRALIKALRAKSISYSTIQSGGGGDECICERKEELLYGWILRALVENSRNNFLRKVFGAENFDK